MTFSPLLTLGKKKATKKQVSEMNEKRKWFSSPPEGCFWKGQPCSLQTY